jgi:kynurenine formamidase
LKATFKIKEQLFTVDLSKPLDISIPLKASTNNPEAWYLDAPKIEPVKLDNWVGKVSEGASVNFNNIYFNPHAHGTHTECVGHISEEFRSVNEALKEFFFLAEVISVAPQTVGNDQIIPKIELQAVLNGKQPEAVVIRTLPNTVAKQSRKYSHTNWPYLHEDAALFLKELGIKHLLIDLPSVDKEKDEGKLLAHRAFWNYPKAPRYDATITEFIYVPNEVKDGQYLLNLQIAPFHNDATPSKPVLFKFL